MNCQIEYASNDSDVGMPCGKLAVAKCADCGTSFCEFCYDDHTMISASGSRFRTISKLPVPFAPRLRKPAKSC